MPETFQTGLCSCGKCTFSVMMPHYKSVACHCLDCQRRTGSAFSFTVYFHESHMSYQEKDFANYQFTSKGGRKITSYFCDTCGTSLFFKGDMQNDLVGVNAGCFLDGVGAFDIDQQVYCEDKAEFVTLACYVAFKKGPRVLTAI